MCGSTCFGRLPAHHQEHTTAQGVSGFTAGRKRLERCWSWSGRSWPARPWATTFQPLPSNGKTRDSLCSCMFLMMGGETSETCWATHNRQVINLSNCCILLVDLFESYDDARTCERQIWYSCFSSSIWLPQKYCLYEPIIRHSCQIASTFRSS